MRARTGRFRRSDRLLRSRDYRRLSGGERVVSRCFVMLVGRADAPSEDEAPRLGITASRKVGNAVIRNAVKRRVREWFRAERGALRAGSEIVVIARRGAAGLGGREVSAELVGLARRSRVLRGDSA